MTDSELQDTRSKKYSFQEVHAAVMKKRSGYCGEKYAPDSKDPLYLEEKSFVMALMLRQLAGPDPVLDALVDNTEPKLPYQSQLAARILEEGIYEGHEAKDFIRSIPVEVRNIVIEMVPGNYQAGEKPVHPHRLSGQPKSMERLTHRGNQVG